MPVERDWEAEKRRRKEAENIPHTVECGWWNDWHKCDCGEFERAHQGWMKNNETR